MLVNDENIVEQRPIEVRQSIDHNWLVSDGLSGGEKVVVEGLQKIAVDSAVEIEIETETSLQQAQE